MPIFFLLQKRTQGARGHGRDKAPLPLWHGTRAGNAKRDIVSLDENLGANRLAHMDEAVRTARRKQLLLESDAMD